AHCEPFGYTLFEVFCQPLLLDWRSRNIFKKSRARRLFLLGCRFCGIGFPDDIGAAFFENRKI
ncbi:hypothetical protein QUA82_16775, partial [Microcoleus sp. F8-D3]